MTQQDYPRNFRALCVELVDAYAWCIDNYMSASPYEDSLVQRAHAALAQPEPPSLKEQALAALNEIEDKHAGPTIQEQLIRRALEQLPE
jgi:hypothetical protein